MASSYRVTINTEILLWARETIFLTLDEAARRIGVKPEALTQWESGETKPTVIQLRKAASVYKRPVATFYLPDVPDEVAPPHDYRILPGEGHSPFPPELAVELRSASLRREVVLELSEYLGEEIAPFRMTVDHRSDVERISNDVRRFLGVSLDEQYRWKDEYKALRKWKELLENAGVLVFQASRIPIEVMRGFSLSKDVWPVVVMNSKDSPRGRIFTLMHELCHLMQSEGGLCDFRESKRSRSHDQAIEIFCNRLAGAVLVPGVALLAREEVKGKVAGSDWKESELIALANAFKVSTQVALRRLLIVGRITRRFFEAKMEEYSARTYSKPSGWTTEAGRTVANNGHRYVKTVLDAYYGDIITASDLSNYLGVRLKHIGDIERKMGY